MKDTGLEKEPRWSYIEVGGQVHSFVAGDRSHALTEELYMKLEEITFSAREQGYMPETEWILHNIEEEEKEESLEVIVRNWHLPLISLVLLLGLPLEL